MPYGDGFFLGYAEGLDARVEFDTSFMSAGEMKGTMDAMGTLVVDENG